MALTGGALGDPTAAASRIGAYQNDADEAWDGLIDDVRVYDDALDAAEVAALAGPTLTTTGSATAAAGQLYTLNLDSAGPETITSWTINWGDGAIETFAGDPSSVTHTYTNVGFTNNILASATTAGGTYFQDNVIVASYSSDDVISYVGTTGGFLDTFDATTLKSTYDVIIGPDGMVYASGWESGTVHKYDPTTGADLGVFATNVAWGATGIAFGPDGNLYVADYTNDKILQYDGSDGTLLSTFVDTSTEVDGPGDLVFGPNGDLYVGGYTSDNVYKYDGTTGALITELVTAASGYLNSVNGLTFGPDGNLYVGSAGDNEVYRFDPTTGALVAGPSDDAFVRAADNGSLSWATGLSFGPDGNLYVGSYDSDEVLRFDGTTGAYIDVYADTSTGPLNGTEGVAFVPGHQVTVVADTTPPTITARETVDSDGNGQIDHIKITASENLDDDFSGLTITVDGYDGVEFGHAVSHEHRCGRGQR